MWEFSCLRPRTAQQTEACLRLQSRPFCPAAGRWALVPLHALECVCHPSLHSRIKRRLHCIAFGILTLSSFFFPSPSPLQLPLFRLLFPQGLSHLMMSEQGRCVLLVVLQLPQSLAFVPLAGGSDPHHRCRPFAACSSHPGPGWQQSPLWWEHLFRRILVSHPHRLLGFAILHICHQGAGPAGLPLRGKHETRHDGVGNGGE